MSLALCVLFPRICDVDDCVVVPGEPLVIPGVGLPVFDPGLNDVCLFPSCARWWCRSDCIRPSSYALAPPFTLHHPLPLLRRLGAAAAPKAYTQWLFRRNTWLSRGECPAQSTSDVCVAHCAAQYADAAGGVCLLLLPVLTLRVCCCGGP